MTPVAWLAHGVWPLSRATWSAWVALASASRWRPSATSACARQASSAGSQPVLPCARASARARRAWATSSASGGSPQPVGGVEAALGEVGHGTHAGQPGLQDRVGGVGRCAFGQAACAVQLAGLRSGLGGQREPAGVGCRVGGELYRALGGGRRGRVPASGDRLGGGALQRGGRLLVRSG